MYVSVSQRTTQRKTGYTPVIQRTQEFPVSKFSIQPTEQSLVGFEAPRTSEVSSTQVTSLGDVAKSYGQMAKTFARETIRQPASVGVEISSRLDQLLGKPKIEQLAPSDFAKVPGLEKTAKFLFGEEAIPSLDKRIQAGTEIAQKLGFEGPAAKAASSFFILGITGLDFLPFGGNIDDVVKALRVANKAEDTAKILRTIGVAEDLIPEASVKFASLVDNKAIKEGLESIAKTQQSTKVIPKAYTPVAQRQALKTAPGEAIGGKVEGFIPASDLVEKTVKYEGGWKTTIEQKSTGKEIADIGSSPAYGKQILKEGYIPIRGTEAVGKIAKQLPIPEGLPQIPVHKFPKIKTGKEQLAEREIAKTARLAAKLERESLVFPNSQLENQYQNFKKVITPSELDEVGDVVELGRKAKISPAEVDNLLYSQEMYASEVFDLFKERRFKESISLPTVPKETKAIFAEKVRQKIYSAKDILDRRRSFIRAVQKQFGLTDSELRQITQRDIRLMNNIEFKNHLDNIRIKAEQLAEKRQALNELESTIQTKELQRTENLQKALKLPTIPNMTTDQLRSFNETLSQFKQGDEFLSVRKLETVDNTDLRGIKTLREAKESLAQELGVDISKLDNIKVEALDRYRYDTALAERNPFYGLMVDTVNKSMLNAEARYLKVEEEINRLINAARKSRPQGILGKFVPQDKKIFQWLESSDDVKKTLQLTNEELEATQYIQKQYAEMRDYLVQHGTLKKYRQDYITHINRGFLESWKEDGLLNAFKNVFKNYQREEAIFNIISDTGQILPLEKFFKFSMRRTGGIEPTQNVANAFLSYLKAFEKKAALDSIVPKLDIYAHSLTPKTMTPRGLEFDRSLKTFVNEWLNTKKGRTAKIVGVEQGGKIDLLLRTGRAFTAMLDLGLNIPIGLASRGGENITNFINLGTKRYVSGLLRARTAQGQKIVSEYKNFVGRTPFSELYDARKGLGDKLMDATFGLFQDATVRSNKTFLLGSLTDEEFKVGKITAERLAELKREMGRYRVVEGAKSVVGSTSVGGILTQYKSWAIPPLRTTIDNVTKIIKNPSLIKAREGQEILRGILSTLGIIFVVKSFVGDEEDDSFLGTLISKAYRDAMTLVGALDPKTITSEPRLISFISDLGEALSQIIKFEEYSETGKRAGELKGPESLERALTPRAIKQFIPKETTEPKPKKFKTPAGLPELPSLKKTLPTPPGLPKLPKF